jgi:hypothetical protein
MLTRLAHVDRRTIRVVTLPSWVIQLGMFGILLIHRVQGKEGSLNFRYFAQINTAETFLDPQPSKDALGYQAGGMNEAFRETVEACKS